MDIKQGYKRADGTFVVDGYHVCPKDIDPMGKYDIAEVAEYVKEHPECLIDEPMPPEPTQAEKDAQEIREINTRFDAITMACVRPLRAMQLGADTADDAKRLEELDQEAADLRKRLAELNKI